MESLKSLIVCLLFVMTTTSAFKLTEPHEHAMIKTFHKDSKIYSGLKDYIKLDEEKPNFPGNYPNRSLSTTAESFDAIVEIAIVCDKEWGDLFQHNRQEILKYWTVFFWDVNAKYQTLPSVNVTFRITSVTVMSSFEEQPFIEETRDENGVASMGASLRGFGDWMGEQWEAGKFPNYDIAVLSVKTRMKEEYAGLAFVGEACRKDRGVGIFYDQGLLSTAVATHEIGHVLGAGHDHETSWCPESGYIMEFEDDKTFFFSWCSDVQISEYAKSDKGSCLRRIDEPGNPVIGQGFEGASPPTVQEQCKKIIRDPNAVVPDAELGKCRDVLCWASPENGGYGVRFGLAENSKCDKLIYGGTYLVQGRCFRNRCKTPSAQLINVGSNQCLLSGGGRFLGTDNATAIMDHCPQHQTPLNSVYMLPSNYGEFLTMAYASPDGRDIGDKCLSYEEDQEQHLQLRFVNYLSGGSGLPKGWTLKHAGNEQFLLLHTLTKKCLKQTGNGLTMTENCDQNDKSMLWRFRK